MEQKQDSAGQAAAGEALKGAEKQQHFIWRPPGCALLPSRPCPAVLGGAGGPTPALDPLPLPGQGEVLRFFCAGWGITGGTDSRSMAGLLGFDFHQSVLVRQARLRPDLALTGHCPGAQREECWVEGPPLTSPRAFLEPAGPGA